MAKASYEKLVSVRFSAQIASRLEEQIMTGELHPGDKLPPERELAETFGVSRSAVREALKMLEERGLVQSRMGHGSFVSAPSLSSVISSITIASRMLNSTIDHLTEIRLHLEVPIAGLAALRATPADIVRMEAALAVMDDTLHNLHDPDSVRAFVKADLEFHAGLAAATQNPFFVILSNSIFDILQEERAKNQSTSTPVTLRGNAYHHQLLECVKKKDAVGAREKMAAHLEFHAEVARHPAQQ